MDAERWKKGGEWRWVFILVLILLLPCPPAAQPLRIPQLGDDSAQAFFAALQQRVRNIVTKVNGFYSNSCGLLQECAHGNGPAPLRLICSYPEHDNMTCESGFIFNTSNCTEDSKPGGKECQNLLVNYNDVTVRLPNVDDLRTNPLVRDTIFQDICIQASLKSTLKESLSREEYLRSGLVYFGSILTGVFVNYPGLRDFKRPDKEFPFNCRDFDPRFRPWFAEASSPIKKVSIVVDLTNDIGIESTNKTYGYRSGTRLEGLNRTLSTLLKTFQDGDTVSLTAFPAADLDVAPESVTKIDDPLRCKNLRVSLERLSKQDAKGNLTEGIQRGISKLREMWTSSQDSERQDEPQVLLVFTRGQVDVDAAAKEINSYNTEIRWTNRTRQNLAVFIYGVDVTMPNDFENYTRLAAAVNGTARNLGIDREPLLGLYSYFNYLAQFHRTVTEPYFVKEYRHWSVDGLGNGTSIILPVFDSQGRFLGVGAIDLRQQSAENETIVKRLIDDNNIHKPRPLVLASPKETLNLPDCSSAIWPCYDGFGDIGCDTRAEEFRIKKERVIYPDSSVEISERCVRCCGNCGSCTDRSGGVLKMWELVLISVGAFMFLFLAVVIVWLCLKYHLCCLPNIFAKRKTVVSTQTIKLSKF